MFKTQNVINRLTHKWKSNSMITASVQKGILHAYDALLVMCGFTLGDFI